MATRSSDAIEMDLLGDSGGQALGGTQGAAPGQAVTPSEVAAYNRAAGAARPKNLITDMTGGSALGHTDADKKVAYDMGNIGGATGAYNMTSDAGRKSFDEMHRLGTPGAVSSMGDFLDNMGEKVGVSGVDKAINTVPGISMNPFASVRQTGNLGTTADGKGGQALDSGAAAPAFDAMGKLASPGGVASAAGNAIQGLGDSGPNFDTSGADRGGMGSHAGDLGRVQGIADQARAGGAGVLGGTVAPGGAGIDQQQAALRKAGAYTPAAQKGAMGDVKAFAAAPEGASAAEQLLNKGQQGAMADVLAAARSGRARDAGSQARAMNVAQGELAGMGVDAARDAATLRAQESQQGKQNQLSALGLQGQLASGLDQSNLQALGLQGDLANQMRQGNIAERGQTLGYDQGMNQIGAGLESDALKTIPQLEGIRHQDQFDLTPQQKLAAAKMGNPSKTTADYVTGLLGDVLSAL